ncbi:MAG: UDP-N-acetylglucosamine 2-epimerase [Nitriliruptorales bacterium]
MFGGTVAQYIKTAPLLRLMDAMGVEYRLIDSGQHAFASLAVRADLGLREPDRVLGEGVKDVDSVTAGLRWAGGLAATLVSGRRLRYEVFYDEPGICIVHGDTVSTLLAALMAKRAGLRVAHLEAGLRSHNLLHPFPEELVRIIVMRLAHYLFAPGEASVANLRRMRVKGRVVGLPTNTTLEALRHVLGGELAQKEPGPVIVTMHRLENLRSGRRVRDLTTLVGHIVARWPTRFVVHPPTRPVLEKRGGAESLAALGVELTGLQRHDEFGAMLRDAPLVVTDGGSIQEECALLGVPTLLWRDRTEREDGLGRNVVLAHHDLTVADRFLVDPERYRFPPVDVDVAPSRIVLETLLAELPKTAD